MRKRITTVLIAFLAIVMCAATVQAQNPTSGTAGPLTWKYDTGTKTLTISGKGEMPNYDWEHPAPWQDHSQEMLILVVEEGITGIGDNAFRNAANLISASLPKTVNRIGNWAFSSCWSLPMVTIPAGVTSIGDYAFSSCSNLALATLPAGLQVIGRGAFYQCKKLSSVVIPAGVISIGDGAFAGCGSLPTITVAAGNTKYVAVDGVLFYKDKTVLLQYPAGRAGTSYVIPKEVIGIAPVSFNDADNLTTVTLPAGVIIIGEWAFANCSKLTSITIPAATESIREKAFTSCRELTEIKVDVANTAYTSVDGVLFDKAKTTLIKYPEGRSATTYTIPAGVTNIDAEAFEKTLQLASVTIPTSVKKIGVAAFASSGLTSVVIPAGVDTIESNLFFWCENLTSVTFPASVKTFRYGIFWGCKSLKSLTVGMKTPPAINENENVFEEVPVANVTLTVPKGSKAAYAAAPVWKEFKQISESTVGNVTLPEARIYAAGGRLYLTLQTAAPVGVYTLNGVLVRTFSAPAGETTVALPQGVYIVRVGDTVEKVFIN
ncbi:hypothetical protein T230_14030 [Tannerella sp. oral taxon BU063 isolate Cell 1/3]|uniref:Cell surface protein n=1 Tax=Tannerella sp. oral taxon BU063 isolate Cell 1/3 TaxID=1411022 RepID=W2CGD4_9BACT|nr:hypothetical protein T230_14030 [Tannerella sp. oral taxon BU063 isolate Cell 1/3]